MPLAPKLIGSFAALEEANKGTKYVYPEEGKYPSKNTEKSPEQLRFERRQRKEHERK